MTEIPATQRSPDAPAQVPVTAALIVYACFALGALVALASSGFPLIAPLFGLLGIVGVIVAYVKRDDARGTWVASHLTWLIRTFWWSLFWGALGVLVMLTLGLILIGIPIALLVWAVASIWVLYRVIRGYALFKDSKPIPGVA